MQDMKGWDLLETQLQREEVDLEAAAFLGEQLASIHKSTTRQAVGEERWQDMMAKFRYVSVQLWQDSYGSFVVSCLTRF